MPRFFIQGSAITDTHVTLSEDDAHHISYALRMAVGDEITVSDGTGGILRCRICTMDGKSVTAEILSRDTDGAELPVEVTLFQAYPKSDKLEFIIQKAVELGVAAVVPFESERCIKRPKADKVAHILARQQRIAEEAAKQSGRALLPTVSAPVSFEDMLAAAKEFPLALFCHPSEDCRPLGAILGAHPDLRRIAVIVGSEGGFSEEEFARARDAGLCPTSLGPRILRCETAPIFLLSAIGYAYELSR